MKKFVWRLQRLLEIKRKQEQVLRGELVALTEQSVAVRGRIMVLKSALRSQLAELKMLPADQRMAAQALYLKYVPFQDAQIRRLQDRWNALESLRHEKLKQLLEAQKFRKGLERLRQKAREEYRQALDYEEQKMLDECTHTDLTRKQLLACS